jgi:Protein of unknown function (DUF2637)
VSCQLGSASGDQRIRWTTTVSVGSLAVIAAVVSFRHMHQLALDHGESWSTAALIPFSVDGMIVASSMSLLLDSRCGRRGGLLPWFLLGVGSLASLAANVAVAEPSVVGRVIAAWPSFALIGAYELLMRQIREAAFAVQSGERVVADAIAGDGLAAVPVAPADEHESTVEEASAGARGRPLQRRAWQWAQANRQDGRLPSGAQIARTFGRSARWGRLVKNSGHGGNYG